MISNISRSSNRESHLSGTILGGQTTRREGEHLLNRQLWDWHKIKVEKGEYYALLVIGKKFNKCQVRTYKLTLPIEVSKYRCAICTAGDCKECPYQGATPGQSYDVLDSLMLLCKTYRSALDKGIWDVAAVLADEIVDIATTIDLPEPDESRSRMNPSVFLGMKMHYEWVMKK